MISSTVISKLSLIILSTNLSADFLFIPRTSKADNASSLVVLFESTKASSISYIFNTLSLNSIINL